MLSVFPPLGIHSNEEHLLNHLEVPHSTSCMGMNMAAASVDLTGVGGGRTIITWGAQPQSFSHMHVTTKNYLEVYWAEKYIHPLVLQESSQ